MGLPSGARAMADRFNRDRKDIQGPESNDDRNRDDIDGGDPTKEEPGLIEQARDFLDQTDKEIRAALGADPFHESFRPGPRAPNDERPGLFGQNLSPRPAEEEEFIPGDPTNLGTRGRRRRTTDDVNASPVMRRGLLGI